MQKLLKNLFFSTQTERRQFFKPSSTNFLSNTPKSLFVGRRGKIARIVFVLNTVSNHKWSNFNFFIQGVEQGFLTNFQLDVAWKMLRKQTRRSLVSFRRFSSFLVLQRNLVTAVTRRKKGGRMGSGKSPIVWSTASVNKGSLFILAKEQRQPFWRGFFFLDRILRKLPIKTRITYLK